MTSRSMPHPSRFRLTFLGSESFSFDLWFSLMPAADGEAFGGIIYGLQSSSRESRRWPHFHQQFVLVSSTGDLYCSILDSRPVVATKLDSNRWYHLALTYDNETQSQDVYLDGAKVHSSTGTFHNEWGYLTHEQIGTGCITAGSLHVPRPSYVGWYGFHGILDDFRVWNGKLLQDDVKLLAPRPLSWVNVQLTMCTRPTEGKHMQLVSFQSSKQPNCTIS
ncbi:uncharacterized protein PITG_11557 [Phytophthora infestans T30-4]|uniref:LamG-like jellyroll fold domain-containing protein n=1 Tax=Phytophthora infestans (strain T30-4) TaxID=403677 RepID=D0NI10_PHYIT|nr:uncharacterized protein PITG_11557 [Phytophthora infestans T30-4]EEY59095.1 conserved hypothetical protein [Phytophthora infestans T30-4]|eukprot:XP_002901109.1 conserved hypothetical protein [Phytophthora infestans T30-4]